MTLPGTARDKPVRVKRIELENFRGWASTASCPDRRGLELDADFVFISAENGRGKSSLIEALARAVAGVAITDDKTITNLHALQQAEGQATWSVTATCQVEGSDEERVFTANPDEPVRPVSPGADSGLGPETQRRAAVFTQDPLDDQFESPEDDPDTLLGFLFPFPNWLENYLEAIRTARQAIEQYRPQESWAQKALLDAEREWQKAADRLAEALQEHFEKELGAQPKTSRIEETLQHYFPGLPPRAKDPIAWAYRLKKKIERIAPQDKELEELEEKLHQAKQRQDALEKDWPRELVSRAIEQTHGLPETLELLLRLAEQPRAWSRLDVLTKDILKELGEQSQRQVPALDEVWTDLGREFGAVDRGRAARVRDAVAAWLVFWEDKREEHAKIKAEVKQLEQDIEERRKRQSGAPGMARLAQDLLQREVELHEARRHLEDEVGKRKRWTKIEPILLALEEELDFLASLRASAVSSRAEQELVALVQSTLNALMAHFVVAGLYDPQDKVTVSRQGKALTPNLRDGRQLWGHLSTGQKAQEALAWLLATNALLMPWLPHRLILLDDVTTALDLTNLAAECALLRKFAYARPDHERKRQVFLASHHDELSNRVLELMLPPDGYRMLEVRLTDWSLEKGPSCQIWEIKPTRVADKDARKDLARALAFGMTDQDTTEEDK